MKCFLLQRFEGLTLKKQGFPFPTEVTFSLLGLSNGCGEHYDKFSLATESTCVCKLPHLSFQRPLEQMFTD